MATYAGGATTNKIYKFDNNLNYTGNSTSYEGTIYSLTSIGSYIYIAGLTTNKIYKFDNNLNYIGSSISYGGTIEAICSLGSYIYAGGLSVYKVFKFDNDLTYIGSSMTYSENIFSIISAGSNIYTGGTSKRIFKFDDDLNYIGSSESYGDIIRTLTSINNNIFIGGQTINKVFKFNDDLTYIGSSIDYGGNIYSLTSIGSDIIAGGVTTNKIYKFDNNLNYIGSSISYGNVINSIISVGSYIYTGGGSPYKIYKFDNNLNYIGSSISYGGTIYSLGHIYDINNTTLSDTITTSETFSKFNVKGDISTSETSTISDILTSSITKGVNMADVNYISTKLTVEGNEYNDYYTLNIEKTTSDNNGTSHFTATFRNYNGKYRDIFNLNDEVIVYADMDASAITKLFTGIIEEITFSGSEMNEYITISGRDYGAVLQDVTVQPIVFINRDCGEIAKAIVLQTTEGLVTADNMITNTGVILDRIFFNQKNTYDALTELAKLCNYYVYVDENKDVNFIQKNSIREPYRLSSTENITKAKFRTNDAEIFNKIWVYGDSILTGINNTGGIGLGSVFNLSYKPHNTKVYVGGTLQEVGGILNMSDPATESNLKYLVDFNKKNIIFVSGTAAGDNIPTSGADNVQVIYDRSTPIIKLVQDNASIAQYGPKTKIISDTNIKDYTQAVDKANTELENSINPKSQGTIEVRGILNVTPGHTILVNVPYQGINDQEYTIVSARYNFTPESCLDGNILTLTLNKKIYDFVDTLKDTILRLKDNEIGTIEGTYSFVQSNTGSFSMNVKNWSVGTRDIGSSFILGKPINGLLGSYNSHSLGWWGDANYTIQQSGGTW
jgi:prophage tail gpP-like protein